ncbi:acetylglutamate kinase [Salirhabdus sp. Marseille-P4669]|uniref:acetylglutamate kinase n=1 Tax=Salirhabdus sp. Marseille-P4669 TaxID=2042310 RepID=UPI000C7D0CA5|nr:acetylglutamate kinase [Salirhabdus sp. Marseille-P4669]
MKYLIIKFGGSIFEDLPKSFYDEVVQLHHSDDWQPIIVHGGGPLITEYLRKLNIETTFFDGMRKTTSEVLDVVEMVLSGIVNKKIVRLLNSYGGRAVGISGIDGDLLQSTRTTNNKLGLVGNVQNVNTGLLKNLIEEKYIPVISPIGIDETGARLNINGDMAAAAIAKHLGGALCFVSNIPGIYVNKNGRSTVLNVLTKIEAYRFIKTGDIKQGMVPKVQAALDALRFQVSDVVILSGVEKGNLTSFCSGKQVGTRIVLKEACS